MKPFIANFINMGRIAFSLPLFTSGLLLVIVILYTVVRLAQLGAFTRVESNSMVEHRVVAKVEGPEALQIDHEHEILYFISNNPCQATPTKGSIYQLDLKDGNASAKRLAISMSDFQPHGLNLFHDNTGKYLFTNNHRLDGSHTVEIFRLTTSDTLQHFRTISSELLSSPNDLVAVGPAKFYVTNDGRAHDRTTRAIDAFLGRKTGNVLFFDGQKFKVAVDNLSFPNGIALDVQENVLAIGETLSGRIIFYHLDDNYDLNIVDNMQIGRGIDNIFYSNASGQFWLARHLSLFQLAKHRKNVDNSSAYEVIAINFRTKGLKRIFRSDGRFNSGVSAAVIHNNRLFLGAVCDNVLLELMVSN